MLQPIPRLSLIRIIEMNLGFLGLQFSFGLQQANMAPIYSYLGADVANIPLLQLAGPLTGLLVQPIIGAMSDRTGSKWGRRTPYFIIGALMCSVGLFLMPLSPAVWAAVSLLWLLDVGNNVTMEPYRAYVSDRLLPDQRRLGFLSQSAFTGLGQMLAYISPTLMVNILGFDVNAVDAHNIPLVTRLAFTIGAVLSLGTIVWSMLRVPEIPLSQAQRELLAQKRMVPGELLSELWDAIINMPATMRKLALMSLFQWYAMFAYWNYVIYSISLSIYQESNPVSEGFRRAVLTNGEMGGFYNGIAFVAAFLLVPFVRKYGAASMHSICLIAAGVGMLTIPHITEKVWLFVPAVGVGLGWASMMGNPYIILAESIPPERTGVYMGIFNMMIVTPMLINSVTMPLYFNSLLGGDARNVLSLAGVLMVVAAVCVLWTRRNGESESRA
jgi:maltose/moltooligosaccharide transporter